MRRHSSQLNQFNFQRASCGLDASVRIYAKRVDSAYDAVAATMYGIKGVNVQNEGSMSGEQWCHACGGMQ